MEAASVPDNTKEESPTQGGEIKQGARRTMKQKHRHLYKTSLARNAKLPPKKPHQITNNTNTNANLKRSAANKGLNSLSSTHSHPHTLMHPSHRSAKAVYAQTARIQGKGKAADIPEEEKESETGEKLPTFQEHMRRAREAGKLVDRVLGE